jgi:prolyl-tRNA editing enzyme YbaK/EbsC (Cys-tRNA(Pro) deacylase)
MTQLPPSARNVQEALAAAGSVSDVVVLPDSARTAAEAAAALGCEVGGIANSLVFMADDRPLLVMTSGAHRVDTAALARRVGKDRIVRATADEVRTATGQAIGGVAPVGHPTKLETLIDTALAAYDQIWAAGGTPHAIFATTYTELVRMTQGTPVEVS